MWNINALLAECDIGDVDKAVVYSLLYFSSDVTAPALVQEGISPSSVSFPPPTRLSDAPPAYPASLSHGVPTDVSSLSHSVVILQRHWFV